MNWDQVKGNWKQFKGKVKEKWGKLTDDDLTAVAGHRDQLQQVLCPDRPETTSAQRKTIRTTCAS